jgi:hypothetical protein
MGWDTNWASTQAVEKNPTNCLIQLRAALAERASVVASPPTLPGVPASGLLPGTAWFTAFQSAVTSLIPKYANHQTSGGNYTGLTAIPVWSESNMLTAISAASRISAPGASKLTAAWAYQQFQMLNKLRWTNDAKTISAIEIGSKWITGVTGWASAVAAFNAASFAWSGGTPVAGHYNSANSATTFSIRRLDHKASVKSLTLPAIGDAYLLTSASGTFENNDFSSTAGTIGRVKTGVSLSPSSWTEMQLIALNDNSTTEPSYPTPKYGYLCAAYGQYGTPFGAWVMKYDIAGGFDYID